MINKIVAFGRRRGRRHPGRRHRHDRRVRHGRHAVGAHRRADRAAARATSRSSTTTRATATSASPLLLKAKRVRKIICSFPRQADSWHFDALYRAGEIELELVPQGNLAERIRAAGAGIGAFFTPTGYGTLLAEGKETRVIDGRTTCSNTRSAPTSRSSRRCAATAGATSSIARRRATSARSWPPPRRCTIAQVREIVNLGDLDPEAVVTPGIFVKRVVEDPGGAEVTSRSRARPPDAVRSDQHEPLHPRTDGRARRARHSRRRVRQSRHRTADDGRQSPAEGSRDHPAHRERAARHGAGARAGRGGPGPHQRRQAARHGAAGRLVSSTTPTRSA